MTNYTRLYLAIINLFCLIFIGFLLRKSKIVDENTMTGPNKLIFNVLLPVKIMMSFYNVEFGDDLSLKYPVYLNVILLFHIFLTFYPSKITNEDKSVAVLEANGMSRGSLIIMSFPTLSVLFGDKGIVTAGAVTGISQSFYNFHTVSVYESLAGENNSNKTLLINVFKTPLTIGLFVRTFSYVTKINISFLEASLRNSGDIMRVLALVTTGYGLSFRINLKKIKSVLKVSVVKPLVFPLTGLSIEEVFGLSEIQKVVALTLFSAPTVVSTYVSTKRYHQDDSLAGYYVVSTAILYLFTLSFLAKLI